MNKSKNGSSRPTSRTNQDQMPSQLLPRSEVLVVLTSNSPISSSWDAKNWFKSKGWILSGEKYSKSKLADILFTVAINVKMPNEAKLAITVVAYILKDIVEEDFASTLSDKILAKLDGAISNLSVDVDNTKRFLAATSSQQVEGTLAFQKAVEALSGNVDQLTQASDKAMESIGAHQKKLSDIDLPRLGDANPNLKTSTNPLNPRSFSLSPAQAKIQQQAALASKQIYMTMDQDDDKAPTSRSIEDQRKLRDDFSHRLTEAARDTDPDFNNPRTIHGVKILHIQSQYTIFESYPEVWIGQ